MTKQFNIRSTHEGRLRCSEMALSPVMAGESLFAVLSHRIVRCLGVEIMDNL